MIGEMRVGRGRGCVTRESELVISQAVLDNILVEFIVFTYAALPDGGQRR